MPGDKLLCKVWLQKKAVLWLKSMMNIHNLCDISKTIRCCVTCVATENIREGTDVENSAEYEEISITLANQQMFWAKGQVNEECSFSDVLNGVINACMGLDDKFVFGVVRCKTKISQCKGALAAITEKNMQESRVKAQQIDVDVNN